MDWNALKIVLAIADTGSLSGAAKKLEINHSTAFRRLNAFEKEIGGRLFERLNHGYELTSTGEELLIFAQQIASSFNDLERRIVGNDAELKGVVKITAPNNITYRYLPRYFQHFRQRYPEICIELLASNLLLNMNERQADIAIRATPSPPENLVGRQIGTIKWSVYGSKKYAQTFGFPASIKELGNHQLIGASNRMRNLPGFIWLDKHFPQQVRVRSDDMVTMSYLAETGQGLAFLPDDQQRLEIEKLFTFEPGETSALWILTHPDLRNVERVRLVMQHLIEEFSKENNI